MLIMANITNTFVNFFVLTMLIMANITNTYVSFFVLTMLIMANITNTYLFLVTLLIVCQVICYQIYKLVWCNRNTLREPE